MQHRQQVMLLDEVKHGRLLLVEEDGEGQVIAALNLVQLGCNLQQSFCIASRSPCPAHKGQGELRPCIWYSCVL